MKVLREVLLLHFLWLFPFRSPGDVQGRAVARAPPAAVVPADPTRCGDVLATTGEVWVEGHSPCSPPRFPVGSGSPAPPAVPLRSG